MTEQNKFSQRMHIKGLVRQASEIIAYHYPMRTFVHHNPLHGLEDLTFEEALREGARSLGSKEYLSIKNYREYFENGRIKEADIDNVLSTFAEDKKVTIAGREISHSDVLKSHLISGMVSETSGSGDTLPQRYYLNETIELLNSVFEEDSSNGDIIESTTENDIKSIGKSSTLA